MRKEKGKYLINRTMYKDIKKFDHQQMENFLTDVYKSGYQDGEASVTRVELQDVEVAPRRSKESGRLCGDVSKVHLEDLFRKEQKNGSADN